MATVLESDGIAVERGAVVSGFWPMRSEVDVRPMMFGLMERGARLCLPAILDKQTIVFRELHRGAPLIDMGFGTAGPDEITEGVRRLRQACRSVGPAAGPARKVPLGV